MPISTDDAARRVPFIWLGPVDFPLPFEARGSAWVAGIVLTPVAVVAAWMATPMFLFRASGVNGLIGLLFHLVFALVAGTAAAVLIVRAVGRRITTTRPLRHHRRLLREELEAPRPQSATEARRSVPEDLFIETRPSTTYVVAPRPSLAHLEKD